MYKNITSDSAWQLLAQDNVQLVDVRNFFEHDKLGIPCLMKLGKEVVLLPIRHYPDMVIDPNFMQQLDDIFAKKKNVVKLLFICAHGSRSASASAIAAEEGYETYNIADGFEGGKIIKGKISGWKNLKLPWRQVKDEK